MEWKYTIFGNPQIKKNSRSIAVNKATGRMFPFKSAKLRIAEQDALAQLMTQRRSLPPVGLPVSAKFLFFRGDKRAVDLSNLYEFPQDLLQGAGIIENDSLICSHDGSRKLYDKNNPRTEITLTLFQHTDE